MNSVRPGVPVPQPSPPAGPVRNFSPLEVFLTVTAVVLAILLFFSVVHRVRQQAKYRAWEKQLQGFAGAFADYRARQGHWPEDTRELGARLNELGWSKGSPFGGDYGWIPPATSDQPGQILLTAFHPGRPLELAPVDLHEVDRQIDDGNAVAGNFRTGFNGWPVYLVRKSH